jgi:hypothetical protein
VLEEIIPLAVATRYPVAVVDDDGELVGEIGNATLLKNLVSDERWRPPIMDESTNFFLSFPSSFMSLWPTGWTPSWIG